MGISSSLNAGVSGLAVNAAKLATISDNIANSQTYGYKRAGAEFADIVLAQQSGAYAAGGVRAFTYRDAGAQGALVTTRSATDIAISGRGMLAVTDAGGALAPAAERQLMLTSTGSFAPDPNGFLRTQSGLFLLGWPADANGVVGPQPRDSGAGLEPIRLEFNALAASPTDTIRLGVNLPAADTAAGASGAPYQLPIEYFDTLGRSQTLGFTFTPTVPAAGSSNAWRVSILDGAGDPTVPVAEFDVTFDTGAGSGGSLAGVTPGAGATYDAATGVVTIPSANGPISVDIGAPGGASPLTQLGGPFAPLAVTKNGAPIGTLRGVEIDERGFVNAIFDTGFRRTIAQIPVADVPNFKGLAAAGNQAFTVTQASGGYFLWNAGEGPVGETVGFALSESTTDIASELTDLIKTQRAYSSNAKIIQTVDEMLQETTNII